MKITGLALCLIGLCLFSCGPSENPGFSSSGPLPTWEARVEEDGTAAIYGYNG